MLSQIKKLLISSEADIKSWQVCLSLAGFAYPLWSHFIHWSYPFKFTDSPIQRWALGLSCLLTASFPMIIKNKKFLKLFTCLSFIVCIVVSLHYYYLTRINNFHTLYAIGYFLILSISVSFFTNIIQSIIFAPISLFIIYNISYKQTFIHPFIYIAWCLTIMGSLYWVNFFKQKYFKNLLFSLKENLKLKENLQSSSRYAALGEMASGMGHEINNPLMVINTNLELLKINPTLKNNKSIVAMQKSIEKISELTKGLKNFQNITNLHEQNKISTLLILNEVLPILNPKIETLKCQIDLIDKNNQIFIANKKVLSQIFFNLINNSLDAIEKSNKKSIAIKTEEDSSFVFIHFTDTGIGILKENEEKLFTPFFTTKSSNHTGLGLSICKQLALSLKGDLYYSVYKGLTRFTLKIPKH